MRKAWALFLVCLVGCTTQDVAPATGDARFSDYPETLITAFRAACEGPAQTFSNPKPNLFECEEYLPPEPTAAIILNYDGTTDDLPVLVIRFRTTKESAGYLVENDLNRPSFGGDY